MSSRPPITFGVVNFEGERLLPDTLSSVLDQVRDGDDVIVVDNGSCDQSLSVLDAYDPPVRVVTLSENRGPGVARNVAFRRARHDRVLLLDNDIQLEDGCPERLLRGLRTRSDAVFAVPTVVHDEHPDTVQYGGASAHVLGLVVPSNVGRGRSTLPSRPRPVGSLISACFLVDRERWDPDTLFDEQLFIYQEDHELGLRARVTGRSIVWVPGAVCRHGAGTAGLALRSSGRHHPVRVVNTIRNRWLAVLSNYRAKTLVLLAPSFLVFELLQLAGAVRKGWTRHWLRAVRDVLATLPERLARRRDIQARRDRGDGEVLRAGAPPFTDELLDGRAERLAAAALTGLVEVNWHLTRRFL